MSFADEVNEAAAAARPTKDVDVIVAGKLRTFRFTQLTGQEWGWLVAINPVRLESPLDRRYGYNFHGVCHGAAKLNGVVVDGDSVETVSAETWDKLWPALSGHDYQVMGDTIWELNEYAPGAAVAKAKKALLAESKAKRS
jgi:hypothetical protein